MLNVFRFKRMNSDIQLCIPTHTGKDHQPQPTECPGAISSESLGVMSWMDENKQVIERFVSAIDDATNWITSDKMFVQFANVAVDGFDTIEEMDSAQSFCYAQQLWPGHPLWALLGSKPSELTFDDIANLSLAGVDQHKTQQCFAVAELSSQHELSGQYVCVLTAVGEGDWEEEVFQVSFLFLKLKASRAKHVCSFRAEFPQDVEAVVAALWTLADTRDLSRTTFHIDYTYQFPTLEPTVEIQSTTVTAGDIQDLLEKITDSHVMLETLRPVPLHLNTLQRTYTGVPFSEGPTHG